MLGGGFTTSQTRGSSSKTRWPQLPNRLQCRRRDGGPPGTLGAVARDCDSPRLPLGGARQVRTGGGAIVARHSRHTSHESSRPRGVSGHFTRRQVGGVHRWRGWQTTDFRAAHCWRRVSANHARCSRSRVPSLVARLELDPVFLAGGIRNRPGEHLGDPGAWRRAPNTLFLSPRCPQRVDRSRATGRRRSFLYGLAL